MKKKETLQLFIRYLVLLIIGLFGLSFIYAIFTPITAFPVFFLLKIIYNNTYMLSFDAIVIGQDIILLVPACIAGAAYFLLLILNLTTPMPARKRAKSILFLLASFLVLNIFRIVLFSYLFVSRFAYFDITHYLAWYVGSTILVALIWFVNVWLFNIKSIPVYSDIKMAANYLQH